MPSEIVLTIVQPEVKYRHSYYRKCVICGIKSGISGEKHTYMSKLPLDKDRCKQWVQLIGNEDLVYVPIEKLNKLKYVCENHFTNKDFNRKRNRLKSSAVPSKDLRMPPLPDSMFHEFPYHVLSVQMSLRNSASGDTADHSYSWPPGDHTYACTGDSCKEPLIQADKTEMPPRVSEDEDRVKEKKQSLLQGVQCRPTKIKTKKRKLMDNCDAYVKVTKVLEETVPVKMEEEVDDTVVFFMEVTDESDVDDDVGYRITCDSESGNLTPTRDMDMQSDSTDHPEEQPIILQIKDSIEEAVQNDNVISDVDRFSFNILTSLEKTVLERSKIREELKTSMRSRYETFCDNFALKAMQFTPVLAAELQTAVCALLSKYINKIVKREPG